MPDASRQEDTRPYADPLEEAAADAPRAADELAALPNLAALMDVPLQVSVEVGRTRLPLSEVAALGAGSVVELDRLVDEPLDLYANDRLIARGELVVLNDMLFFRVIALSA